jgi:uncharacterized membrane protein YdjX (TVP38/TMEM64 family)
MERSLPILNASHVSPSDESPSAQPGFGRTVLVAAVLVAAVLVIHYTPVHAWLGDAQRVRAAVLQWGYLSYPLSVLVAAILVACGVPRLLLCAAGGMVFGFWVGLSVTFLGTILGHYAAFLFIRWGGRDWALQKWPRLRKWADVIHDQGIVGVFLIRQLPGHAMFANLCLGLSHVKHVDFLIGTMIGILPEAIPATLVGAGLVKASLNDSAIYLGLAGAVVAMLWIVSGYALRARRNRTWRTVNE